MSVSPKRRTCGTSITVTGSIASSCGSHDAAAQPVGHMKTRSLGPRPSVLTQQAWGGGLRICIGASSQVKSLLLAWGHSDHTLPQIRGRRGSRPPVPCWPPPCARASALPYRTQLSAWALPPEPEALQGHNRPKSAGPSHSLLLAAASAPAPFPQGAASRTPVQGQTPAQSQFGLSRSASWKASPD